MLILSGVIGVLVGLPVAALLWMTSVPGRSHAGPLPPLTAGEARSAGRLRADVAALAAGPRNTDHPEALERAALHVESELRALGYPVRRQPFAAAGREVRNIETIVEPARADAPTLVVGAHYDS